MRKGQKLDNVLPILPDGICVVDRTAELEMLQRSKSKYNPIIDTLKIIDSSKCVQMDITGANKGKINTIKIGIRTAAKHLGIKTYIKFAIKDNILFIWTNR